MKLSEQYSLFGYVACVFQNLPLKKTEESFLFLRTQQGFWGFNIEIHGKIRFARKTGFPCRQEKDSLRKVCDYCRKIMSMQFYVNVRCIASLMFSLYIHLFVNNTMMFTNDVQYNINDNAHFADPTQRFNN